MMTISTNARPSDLRPSIMATLYSSATTYLHRKGDAFHLLCGVAASPEVTERFGEAEALFNPFEKRWYTYDGLPLNQRELRALIGDGEICMGGKNCPKHKEGHHNGSTD